MSSDSSSASRRRPDVVPRPLDGFIEAASRAGGIGIIELDVFTTLEVRTVNSVYRITVLKPYAREVLVEGGTHFPERTRAFLIGSSVKGGPLKLGWIGLGLHLEFHAAGRRIITSRVRSIALEPSATGAPC